MNQEIFLIQDCEWCCIPFKPTRIGTGNRSHRFCSESCQQKAKNPPVRVGFACLICGTIIMSTPGKPKKYCSNTCRRTKEKTCRGCETALITSTTQQYCSPKCYPSIPQSETDNRPPFGQAAIYYIHEKDDPNNVRYIGWTSAQSKTWGAILSDKRRPNRGSVSKINVWLNEAIEPTLTPIIFVPKDQAAKLYKEALLAAAEANWDLLNDDNLLLTDEEREQKRRESDRNYRRTRGTSLISKPKAQRVFERFYKACAYCGIALPPPPKEGQRQWHIDHIIAIANGGNKRSETNLVPSCPPCNEDKHDKCPIDWLSSRGMTPFPF